MHPAVRWLLVAALLVAIAGALNAIGSAIEGHVALGLAAALLLGAVYLARSVGIDPLE